MTLFPFLNLSFVSSFILFVLLFLYGREDNLQAHKMPATTNVDPINLFIFKKYIYNVGKSEGETLGEKEALIFGMFMCTCVSRGTHAHVYVRVHICIHTRFQKKMSLVSASLHFVTYICVYTHTYPYK